MVKVVELEVQLEDVPRTGFLRNVFQLYPEKVVAKVEVQLEDVPGTFPPAISPNARELA